MNQKTRRAALLIVMCCMAVWASAQTMYDALRFSENNYSGTARSYAMGNAFTALGGDLGGLTINPAGSAVANYSQVTITPGINIVSTSAKGTKFGDLDTGFGRSLKSNKSKFSFPNLGFMINFDTGRKTGLKNASFGVVANGTGFFNDNLQARGSNAYTSFMGSLAYQTNGIDIDALAMKDAYNNSSAPWQSILGYRAGLIANYGPASNRTEYIGTSEGFRYIGPEDGDRNDLHNYEIMQYGALDQNYGRLARGAKYDYLINFGLNISDRFYFGANLGITSMEYFYHDWIKEAAQDPSLFPIVFHNEKGEVSGSTCFSDMEYHSKYEAVGVGVYGKFGFIVRPVAGLRIGGAIQTPTSTRIKEYWHSSAASYYTDGKYNVSDETPEGEYVYRLVSPFRFNIGLAYTFGKIGLISADYEMCNYSAMKFKETSTIDNSVFDDGVNMDIKEYMGPSHMLRAGIEVKPLPVFAIRAGYGLQTSPEKYYDRNNDIQYVKANRHSVSAGLGFTSNGSFFADLAFGATKYPDEYIYPYGDYMDIPSPEILSKKWIYNVMLTLGFRF